jgi:hypothetical protein
MYIISTFYKRNSPSEVLYAKTTEELAKKIEFATEPFIPGTFAGLHLNRRAWEGTNIIPVVIADPDRKAREKQTEQWHMPKPRDGKPFDLDAKRQGLHPAADVYPGNLLIRGNTLLFLLTGNGITDPVLYKVLSRRLAMTINGGWFPSKGYDPLTALIDADQSRPVVLRTSPYSVRQLQEYAYVR